MGACPCEQAACQTVLSRKPLIPGGAGLTLRVFFAFCMQNSHFLCVSGRQAKRIRKHEATLSEFIRRSAAAAARETARRRDRKGEAAPRVRSRAVAEHDRRRGFGCGERLHDANLAATLQVSRTPIREALKLLATEGLVDLLPGRGARVSDFSIDDIKQLFEAIAGIERNACELAAERMTDRDLEKLQRLHDRMARHHAAGERPALFQAEPRNPSRDRRCVKQHDPAGDPRVPDDARPPRALRRALFARTMG